MALSSRNKSTGELQTASAPEHNGQHLSAEYVDDQLDQATQDLEISTPELAPRSLSISWYQFGFVGIVLAAFLLRIHRLADRAIHHDESLHALYSWYYYVGRGYIHDPMMHGP